METTQTLDIVKTAIEDMKGQQIEDYDVSSLTPMAENMVIATGNSTTHIKALADEVPVLLNLVSKAEQGYYLAGIYRPELDQAPGELSVTEFLHQLSLGWLLQKPLICPESSLLQVKKSATQARDQALWDEVQAIIGQYAVPELIDKAPRLGALQLALAGSSSN